MGVWDVLKRIAQGKPAFEMPKSSDDWDDDAPTTDFAEDRAEKRNIAHIRDGLVDEKGYKHPPVVEVTHVKTQPDHAKAFDLWVTIRNNSDREVHLQKMTIFGSSFAFNYPLHAHDQRVFHVYKGPLLTHDGHHTASIYYCDTPSGDYFRADHFIEYHFEHDSTYTVTELRLMKPIKDI